MHIRTGGWSEREVALLDHPEGLPIRAILDHVAATDELSEKQADRFEEVMRGCVAPIKAGWLLAGGHHVSISDQGKEAFTLYQEPAKFMQEAGRRSAKGWLSVHFPKPYYVAGKLKDQLVTEMRALVGLVLAACWKGLWKHGAVGTDPARAKIAARRNSGLGNRQSRFLLTYLEVARIDYNEGGHAVYLPPESFKASAFGQLAAAYPPDAGLKIVKGKGGIDDGEYISEPYQRRQPPPFQTGPWSSAINAGRKPAIAKGVGARLYDLIELESAAIMCWTAYVIQHVSGGVPSVSECEAGIGKLRELERQGLMKAILPEGFDDEEFECPKCSDNAFTDDEGEIQSTSISQNFVLV